MVTNLIELFIKVELKKNLKVHQTVTDETQLIDQLSSGWK